jgi:hypothetical protein
MASDRDEQYEAKDNKHDGDENRGTKRSAESGNVSEV